MTTQVTMDRVGTGGGEPRRRRSSASSTTQTAVQTAPKWHS